MLVSTICEKTCRGEFDSSFSLLYPKKNIADCRSRFLKLSQGFLRLYGDMDAILFSVPGRTEISGNHTDHNNGKVLAAAVDIDIIAIAAKTETNTIRIKSDGYREELVSLSSLSNENVRKGSTAAIITGIADYFGKNGFKVGGFNVFTASDISSGSGISSSAAFEVICARIFSELYNGGCVPPIELAKAGKYAENVYFGKPCGLMDQTACALGGCLWIDFENPLEPVIQKLPLNLQKHGYDLCVINTGASHSGLTAEYSAIPKEMKKVAVLMGKQTLRQCDEQDFIGRISYLRSIAGDRAILRALHYFGEIRRVDLQKNALIKGDFEEFLKLVEGSGDSSYKYLQNIYSIADSENQGVALAIALASYYGGISRVHGGGFAGTVQAYIKSDMTDSFTRKIESVFGSGSCKACSVRQYGAVVIKENQIED